jgi:hypothetical protein
MEKRKYNKTAQFFLSGLLFVFMSLTLPHLKAQDTIQLWQRISEGKFDITNNYQVGKYVVLTTVLDKGNKPAIVAGKNSFQPLSVWDLELDTFVAFANNWTGAPMNPVKIFVRDSSTLFVSDEIKMFRAEIEFANKTISYKQVFQGQKEMNLIQDMFIDKANEKIYFISSYLKHYLYTCNMSGEIQNTVEISNPAIYAIRSIVSWNDTIYVGYDYMGGLADGSGLAILDPNTGQITKIRHPEWMNNSEGCTISVIDGAFYLVTDAAKYKFQRSLFRYQNGDWVPVAIGVDMPKIWNVTGQVVIGCGKNSTNGKGDTLTKIGCFFAFEKGVIGDKEISVKEYLDPRKEIQFSEEFKTEFWQRHGNMPYIDFIYEIGSKTIGFGANIVAELVNINTTAVKSVELTRLSVYPNPAKSTIHISGLQKAVDYEVYDLQGKMLLRGVTMSAVDISSLPSGVLILRTPSGYAKVLKE